MTEAEARGAEDTDLAAALASAREQQAAVSDILRVISRSKDLQEVFDVIATSARRFCSAEDAMVALVEGDRLVGRAHAGDVGFVVGSAPLDLQLPAAGCVVEGRTIHVRDMQTDPTEYFKTAREIAVRYGIHTVLATPMFHDGKAIGSITLRRTEVSPFTDEQIELVRTFADQAVIAIENVRLFNETKEALDRQTALSEVLKIISRSPVQLDEVFKGVIASAVRLCGADNGTMMRIADGRGFSVAHAGLASDAPAPNEYWTTEGLPLDRSSLTGRVMLEHRTIAIADIFSEPDLVVRDLTDKKASAPRASLGMNHSMLGVPLLRSDEVVGVILLRRREIRPFSGADAALAETFADQAVIAIENVRLFNETKESLAQQTALSEVLNTISRSAFDLDAVLQTIVERAAALCQADGAAIFRRVSDNAVAAATFGGVLTAPGGAIPIDDRTVVGRAMLTAERQYVPDARQYPDLPQDGPQTRLMIPFVRDGVAVGCLGVVRSVARPFSDTELRLFEVFADQAAIAIENVRLFNETKESLERQTALAEILRVIASSPTSEQPVLQAIAENAARFCRAADAIVLLARQNELSVAAHHGPIPSLGQPLTLERSAVAGRAVLDGHTVHVTDILGPEGDEFPQARARAGATGQRAMLAAPLLHDGVATGAIMLRKQEPVAFTPTQIQLVEAFAHQAVIAIENVRLFNETKEALKQRTATSEILRVISETLGDPQPVMQAIVDTVLAVCSADSAGFFRRSGDDLILRAVSGTWRGPRPSDVSPQLPFHGDSIVVSALEEGRYQHVADTSADPRYDAAAQWSRTRLAVPVLRGSETIGVIRVGRSEPGGFTEREIRLVEGFAEQAAIAFENARLFNETKEALEQQTAVGDVLKTISRSVFDLQPVLDTVVEHAARLAGGDVAWLARITGEDSYRILSRYGAAFEAASVKEEWGDLGTMRLATSTSVMGRLLRERVVLHIQDITAEKELWDASRLIRATKSRTILAVPMLREGQPIGGVIVGRTTQRPFSDREIQLVQTFADQAAIAIENVRLFDETRESLERQTAVAQVLGAISQSGFELKSVLETVIEHATKLCAAQQGFIYRREGDVYRLAVAYGITPEFKAFTEANPVNPLGRGTITGRVAQDRTTVHVPDVLNDPEYTYWEAQRLGNFRALLGVPMIRNDQVIGVMLLWRTEPQPFTEEQIALVTTFANQATIAIENVRLFDETKEALDRQTALSEILKVISGSTFDLTPVAETVVERAARLCEADYAWIFLPERGQTRAKPMALYGDVSKEIRDELMNTYVEFAGQADLAKTFQEPDVQAVTGWRIGGKLGVRTAVFVPVGRDRGDTGRIVLGRRVVRPFTEQQIDLVEIFADQAAIAIANARLFNEIQDKSRQLEVASRHKSEFLANMSHELRTPLNAIIGFSEVLVQGLFGDVNEKQREYLQDVIGSGQHLLSLINDILDLSKIEAGRMELELSTFSFQIALQSGVTIVRERAARNGIALNVDVSDEVGQVEADERKVKQILYNLLSNAVKFTPDDGRVDVTVRRDNGDVRVEVRDTGIGIAESDQTRIFEEFQQVGRERSREGTGLGLTLTKRFVELHGGRIWLESAPGQGSTFTFTLPLRQAAPVRA